MENLTLVFPRGEHREIVMDYKAEFDRDGENADGAGGLSQAESFEQWLEETEKDRNEETVQPGLVPATTSMAMDGEKLVGMVNIRHRLNDGLMNFGGNIGYSVRKSERRKGYATKMLALALDKCRELGMTRVLLTCSKLNEGSRKTMLKNGAVLENEIEGKDRITQRYWIEL